MPSRQLQRHGRSRAEGPSGLWVPVPPMPRSSVDRPRPSPLQRFRAAGPWARAGAVLLVLAALGATALLVLLVRAIGPYLGHDRIELVEDERIVAAVAEPCDGLAATAGVTGSLSDDPVERAEQVRRLVAAGRPVPAAVLALPGDVLDGDRPAQAWAEDWTRLLDEAERYADALAAGEPAEFSMPVSDDDGYPIAVRMGSVVDGCRVPGALTTLDPYLPRWVGVPSADSTSATSLRVVSSATTSLAGRSAAR